MGDYTHRVRAPLVKCRKTFRRYGCVDSMRAKQHISGFNRIIAYAFELHKINICIKFMHRLRENCVGYLVCRRFIEFGWSEINDIC